MVRSVGRSSVRPCGVRIHSVRFGQLTLTVHINALYNEIVLGEEDKYCIYSRLGVLS